MQDLNTLNPPPDVLCVVCGQRYAAGWNHSCPGPLNSTIPPAGSFQELLHVIKLLEEIVWSLKRIKEDVSTIRLRQQSK